jgi:HK97 family phage portal protein
VDVKSLILAQDAPAQKALPYYPPLVEGPTQPVVLSGPISKRGSFSQKTAARHLSAYGGKHDAIDWVMNCVRLIAETASNAEYHFEKKGTKYIPEWERAADTPEEVKDAPLMLAKLFDEPNPYMGYHELLELTIIDYLLTGNAYWLKYRTNDAGQPLALYRLAPPLIEVVPGQWGIERYDYKVAGTGKLQIRPDNIMHFKQPNPHDPYYGLGVVQGGARMLDMELALTETQASYYEKKAMPSMVVQSERRVPKDVFGRLSSQLRNIYSGPRNSGALMVLEAGLKYQSISPSAQEQQFAALTDQSRDRILAMFRVPGSLLGINQSGEGEGSGASDQRVFDNKTMRPLLNKLQKAISQSVTSRWDEMEFKISYEYLMPVEDRIRLASSFAAIPGVRLREVRAYVDLDPLGDERDEWVLNLPGEDGVEGDTRRGFPDNNQVGERGRPPLPQNTQRFPESSAAPRPGARVSLAAARKAVESETKRSLEDVLSGFEKLEGKAEEPANLDLASRIIPPDDVLRDDRVAAVDGIVAELERELKEAVHQLERGLLDTLQNAVEGKAPGDKIRSKIRKSEAWNAFMASMSAAMEKAAKSAISTAVIQQSRLGRQLDEDLDYDALAKEIVYRSGGARKITQNFKDDIARKVATALKEGETRLDLELAIREQMDFWRLTHAETVALTEATHAYNEGTLVVAEAHGDTHVFVHDGEDDDEPCIEANGQVWTIEDAREKRLEHPRCRRSFTPLSLPEVN